MEAIKTSKSVEFEVIYSDGTRKWVHEGMLFEVEDNKLTFHNGTDRPEVAIAVAEAAAEVVGAAGFPANAMELLIAKIVRRIYEREEVRYMNMTPMDAWRVISANLATLYKMRRTDGYKGYVKADTEAEVIAFKALQEMQKRKDAKPIVIDADSPEARAMIEGLTEELRNGHIKAFSSEPPSVEIVREWIPVSERFPENYVSVLGYMPEAGPFPPVRECYTVGKAFYFPALCDAVPVSHWMPMPEPPKEGAK